MATQPSAGTLGPSTSVSEAQGLLMSIEAQLWSLDRTPEAAPIIRELQQIVEDILQALPSFSR